MKEIKYKTNRNITQNLKLFRDVKAGAVKMLLAEAEHKCFQIIITGC